MKREAVTSTTLRSAGYDPTERLLELEFTSGRVYHYSGVPESEYRDLMAAESKGSYFNQNIRDVYPTGRLRASPGR
jgi:hypothetical protein